MPPCGGSAPLTLYWMFGSHDGLGIIDAPDAVTATALRIAIRRSGAFEHVETQQLLDQDELSEALSRLTKATDVYRPPGERD